MPVLRRNCLGSVKTTISLRFVALGAERKHVAVTYAVGYFAKRELSRTDDIHVAGFREGVPSPVLQLE